MTSLTVFIPSLIIATRYVRNTRSHRRPQRALANQTGEWDLQRPNEWIVMVIRSEELFNALGQAGASAQKARRIGS